MDHPLSPPPPPASSTDDEHSSSSSSSYYYYSFKCGVCLDLLYKPIVLGCGHVFCFWCTNRSMDGFRPSRCAICRQQYNHFPVICQTLHLLLLKVEPVNYKFREDEVLEEENIHDRFSPQFVDLASKKAVADPVSVADLVLCSACNEVLFRPSVLNCGHAYCESCVPGLLNGCRKCQICESLHPANCPKVCWELDHFLKENFPNEYVSRREKVQIKKLQCQHVEPLQSGALETEKHSANSSDPAADDTWGPDGDLSKAHVGVGCDACGMYPIIGKRYRCKDCKEKVGFDLCEPCYNSSSKLPGRFNQRHTMDHRFELDESRMLIKFWMLSTLSSEEHSQHVPEGDSATVN